MKKSTLQHLLKLLAGPLIALTLRILNPFHLDELANNTISIGAWMIIWWILESIPMPVVALMPLLLFPLLKISSIEKTAQAYSNPVIYLFMGGFMIGLAIEKWHLHKRIALQIIRITGTSGKQIILGFILACGFLSMWLSNTATTMMMFPIALSVINVLKTHEPPGKNMEHFSLVLMLVIAYASNIGGMATIIGTPPNVAFAAYIEKTYHYNLQFGEWMLLCTPLAIVLLFAIYWVLAFWLFPVHIRHSEDASLYVQKELAALGPMSTAEKRVMFVFSCTALLWIFKDLLNKILPVSIDDTQIALAGALALFIFPSGDVKGNSDRLLEWSDTSKMAWGILLLFGGGIALASALESTGIIQQIGKGLANISGSNTFLLVLAIVTLSVFLSELMSNVAQVIVFAPVLGSLADALHVNPLLLGIPMTLAASAAAMLPMGTPPNAIVFGSGHIPLKKMIKAGFAINLVCILAITLFCFYILPFAMTRIQH
jgi:sodium-dependent dicarboxylate transporter 2/3/5